MPFFKKKTDKVKAPPDVKQKQSTGLQRTPSNRSRDLNGSLAQGKVLSNRELTSTDHNFESINMINRKSSQLCKTLEEILADKTSIGYFIQFLEDRKAGKLIRFWLDAESFKAATWSRIRTHSLNTAKKKKQNVKDVTGEKCNEIDSANLESGHSESSDTSHHGDSPPINVQNLPVIDNCAKEESSPSRVTISNPTQQNQGHSDSLCDSASFHKQKQTDSPDSDVFTAFPDSSQILPNPVTKETDKQLPACSNNIPKSYQEQKWTDKLKKSIEDDAVRIFSKYLAQESTDPIGVDDVLRSECISKICREDGEVDPECFVHCQNFALSKMEAEHFPSYNGSEYHLKYQIDLVTTGPIYLTDFLFYDPAFFYFMEYMEQEGGSNLLQFWIAVENFEKQLRSSESGYDAMEAQSDAMVLYDKYFSLQASHPLGFDDQCRFDVESNICREEGPLPDCFHKPRELVLKTIDKVYFSEFRQSELFYKFLSELVGTVHSTRELPKQRKRTESDGSPSSSTHSGESVRSTTRNTLLATGTNLHLKKAIKKFENDMDIDDGLLNPDQLWKREQPKMAIGTVDRLGQFKSDFHHHPDTEKAKAGGFFKRRKDKEKEEEEMALKIAQMIINDVTSVTQTVGALKSESTSQMESAIDSKSFSDLSES